MTFGHHPDPSIDYCIETDVLEGMAYEIGVGMISQWPFWGRLSRALKAPTPDDDYGTRARDALKVLASRGPWPEYVPLRTVRP